MGSVGKLRLIGADGQPRIGRGRDHVVGQQVGQLRARLDAAVAAVAAFAPWAWRLRGRLGDRAAAALRRLGLGRTAGRLSLVVEEDQFQVRAAGRFRLGRRDCRRAALAWRMAAAIRAEIREYSRPLSDSWSQVCSVSATSLAVGTA